MKQLKLRLPDSLHSRLAFDAAQAQQSLNAHIIHLLEQSHLASDLQKIVRDEMQSARLNWVTA